MIDEQFDILARNQTGTALTIARRLSNEAVTELLAKLNKSKPAGTYYLKLRTLADVKSTEEVPW